MPWPWDWPAADARALPTFTPLGAPLRDASLRPSLAAAGALLLRSVVSMAVLGPGSVAAKNAKPAPAERFGEVDFHADGVRVGHGVQVFIEDRHQPYAAAAYDPRAL